MPRRTAGAAGRDARRGQCWSWLRPRPWPRASSLDLRTVLGERDDADFLARRVHLFPERDAPPFEMVSPSLEVEAARVAAAHQLASAKTPIVVASVAALAQRTPPREALLDAVALPGRRRRLDVDASHGELDGLRLSQYRVWSRSPASSRCAAGSSTSGRRAPSSLAASSCSAISSSRFATSIPADQRSFGKAEKLVILASRRVSLDATWRDGGAPGRPRPLRRADVTASVRRELDECLAAGVRFPGVELVMTYAGGEPSWIGDFAPDATLLADDRSGSRYTRR